MVFENLQDIFEPKDSTNNFFQLFLVCTYVAIGCMLGNITRALGASRLLILAKPSSGI